MLRDSYAPHGRDLGPAAAHGQPGVGGRLVATEDEKPAQTTLFRDEELGKVRDTSTGRFQIQETDDPKVAARREQMRRSQLALRRLRAAGR